MKEIKVPTVPLEKEDKVVKELLKSSKQFKDTDKFDSFKSGFADDVELVLVGIGMEKYIDVFLDSEVTLDMFLQFDESDLKELGIVDESDIKTILENVNINESGQKKWLVSDSSQQDFKIAENVHNELVLLLNYCGYLELQMRKNKFSDYRINWNESASTYLKAFIETSLVQVNILKEKYFVSRDDSLIGKALKLEHLNVPKPKKTHKRFTVVGGAIAVLGILSVAILLRTFLKSKEIFSL